MFGQTVEGQRDILEEKTFGYSTTEIIIQNVYLWHIYENFKLEYCMFQKSCTFLYSISTYKNVHTVFIIPMGVTVIIPPPILLRSFFPGCAGSKYHFMMLQIQFYTKVCFLLKSLPFLSGYFCSGGLTLYLWPIKMAYLRSKV